MAHWMCSNCGYYSEWTSPPDRCPACKESCTFSNVTSYGPHVAEGHLDLRVAGYATKNSAAVQSRRDGPADVRPASEVIHPVYLFGNLTEQQQERVRTLERIEMYDADAIIARQGTKAHKFWQVDEGQVGVRHELPNGKHIQIAVVSPGGGVGWSAVIRPHQFSATLIALSKTRLRAIEGEALLRLMREDTRIGLSVMQDIAEVIGSRLRNLEAKMVGLP